MIRPGDEPIPGYRLEQFLGRGQYGEVWRATAPGRSKVALKFIDMQGRPGWKEFRSIQRVKQIRHAHLMPIVALWLLDENGEILTDDAVESLASEQNPSLTLSAEAVHISKHPAQMVIATLLGDRSLRDRLSECLAEGLDGIPVEELIGYMQEGAKGIDHLNSVQHAWDGGHVGVQHCDIKPDNVMLMGGSIVICDFGVAKLFDETNDGMRATALSGSPAYMAPESFDGKPSKASDQYAMAIMYYELRTGQLPLDATNFAAAYDAHRNGSLDFSLATKGEQAVLRRATDPDPSLRYASASELAIALRHATHGATLDAPAAQRSTWTRRAATWVFLAAAACLVFFAWRGWGSKQVQVKLRFDALHAHVVINDTELTTGPNGELIVDVPIEMPLHVAATGNEGRKDSEWTIGAAELVAQTPFDFRIPYTAAHHATRAEQFLAAGQSAEAAEAYALAIQSDPEQYARYPEPGVRETTGILWDDCLQFTPDGNWLVIGGMDGEVRRWPVRADGIGALSESLHRHAEARIVNLAVADTLVASACDLGAVWITHDGAREQLIDGEGAEADLAFSGGGNWLVAAVSEELTTRLHAWDARSANLGPTHRMVGEQPGEFPHLTHTMLDAVALATKDVEAIIWQWRVDPPSHGELGRQQNDVLTLCASTDGAILAYAGVANSTDDGDSAFGSGEAAIVDVAANVRYGLASRQSDSILACALDGEGKRLATAERINELNDSAQVCLWRPNHGTGAASVDQILQYDRSLGDVSALAISQYGEWIAAGHEGGAVSLWRIAHADASTTGGAGDAPLLTFGQGDRVVALRISPDQRRLVSGARDGRLMIFDLRRLAMLQSACERAGVAPQVGGDKVTLRDRSGRPNLRSLEDNEETASRLVDRPSGAPVL